MNEQQRLLMCEHLAEVNKFDLYFFWPDGTEAGYLCEYCAVASGFCPSCGAFIAGIDAEIPYINFYGCCYECVSDLEDEDFSS